MDGIEFVQVVEAGPRYTTVLASDGRTYTLRGDRNWRNNNPGNLEYGPKARELGAIGSDGRFAVFPSLDVGHRAQESLQFASKNYRDLTISDAISRYAPAFENNTAAYAAEVAAASGVPLDTRMRDLTADQRSAFLTAQRRVEGFKPGRIEDTTGAPVSEAVRAQFSGVPVPRAGIGLASAANGATGAGWRPPPPRPRPSLATLSDNDVASALSSWASTGRASSGLETAMQSNSAPAAFGVRGSGVRVSQLPDFSGNSYYAPTNSRFDLDTMRGWATPRRSTVTAPSVDKTRSEQLQSRGVPPTRERGWTLPTTAHTPTHMPSIARIAPAVLPTPATSVPSYRAIQEMGPSSVGARPTVAPLRPAAGLGAVGGVGGMAGAAGIGGGAAGVVPPPRNIAPVPRTFPVPAGGIPASQIPMPRPRPVSSAQVAPPQNGSGFFGGIGNAFGGGLNYLGSQAQALGSTLGNTALGAIEGTKDALTNTAASATDLLTNELLGTVQGRTLLFNTMMGVKPRTSAAERRTAPEGYGYGSTGKNLYRIGQTYQGSRGPVIFNGSGFEPVSYGSNATVQAAPEQRRPVQQQERPAGYGSRGYSAGGQMLRDLYGN